VTGAPVKIGIPVLNRGDLLARLVRSIDVPAEVLIVVNRIGPLDESVEQAVELLAADETVRVEVEPIAGNLGAAGVGIESSSASAVGIAGSPIATSPLRPARSRRLVRSSSRYRER